MNVHADMILIISTVKTKNQAGNGSIKRVLNTCLFGISGLIHAKQSPTMGCENEARNQMLFRLLVLMMLLVLMILPLMLMMLLSVLSLSDLSFLLFVERTKRNENWNMSHLVNGFHNDDEKYTILVHREGGIT